jgi:hypothetical protein
VFATVFSRILGRKVSLLAALLSEIPQFASFTVFLVTTFEPPPPLSLRESAVVVPVIVLLCTVAEFAEVRVMPEPEFTLLLVTFTAAPAEFNAIPVAPPAIVLVRIDPT